MTAQPASLFVQEMASGDARQVFRVDRANTINGNGGVRWAPDSRALIANVAGATTADPRALW